MLDLRSPVATPVACWQQGSTLEKSVVGIATVKLKQLQLFARLVEAGSFTRAAHALGVTRSSASRELKQLEAEVGVRLLHRTTRSLKVTDAGRAFQARSHPVSQSHRRPRVARQPESRQRKPRAAGGDPRTARAR